MRTEARPCGLRYFIDGSCCLMIFQAGPSWFKLFDVGSCFLMIIKAGPVVVHKN
jgi:hypothetical protein